METSAGRTKRIGIKAADARHPAWRQRGKPPEAAATPGSPVEQSKHSRETSQGRATDALPAQTVEPVFGIIEAAMGFRQYLLRGLADVRNDRARVCLAWDRL